VLADLYLIFAVASSLQIAVQLLEVELTLIPGAERTGQGLIGIGWKAALTLIRLTAKRQVPTAVSDLLGVRNACQTLRSNHPIDYEANRERLSVLLAAATLLNLRQNDALMALLMYGAERTGVNLIGTCWVAEITLTQLAAKRQVSTAFFGPMAGAMVDL
jgi:hypothetical protein